MIGCTRTVQITELRSSHDPSEIDDIPIIVVGRAIENSHAVSPIRLSTLAGEPRQLWCVRVRIEHVLKGPPLNGNVNIFYFLGDQIPGSVGRLFVYAGHYQVFLLQKEDGKLRTICEDRRTCVYWVRTGAHPGYVPNPAFPLEESIADLMLSRGPHTDDRQMIDAIYHSRLPARPAEPAIRKLRILAQDETAPVRAAAKDELRRLGQNVSASSNLSR